MVLIHAYAFENADCIFRGESPASNIKRSGKKRWPCDLMPMKAHRQGWAKLRPGFRAGTNPTAPLLLFAGPQIGEYLSWSALRATFVRRYQRQTAPRSRNGLPNIVHCRRGHSAARATRDRKPQWPLGCARKRMPALSRLAPISSSRSSGRGCALSAAFDLHRVINVVKQAVLPCY